MQLCAGATPEERQDYKLLPPTEFKYLNGGGCITIGNSDDGSTFLHVKQAMAASGISYATQRSIWRTLSGIMWLGNVGFIPAGDDAAEVDPTCADAVSRAATLLACSEPELVAALTTRKMVLSHEKECIVRQLNVEAANDNRDALAKGTYAALFKWLVAQVKLGQAIKAFRIALIHLPFTLGSIV